MENIVVNELNSVIKGEKMAIEAYEKYIGALKDPDLKREFQSIKNEHEKHMNVLTKRVIELGGNPATSTGFTGMMANTKISIQTLWENDQDILKQAYDGEDKGIAMVEEIIKGDLDQESLRIVQKMMSDDHDHLKRMAHIISSFEAKQ